MASDPSPASTPKETVLTAPSRTSGDLLADRRFAYAEELAREGDLPAAADLFEQTTELVPGWPPVWIALGLARERLGLWEAAADAFARAERLDASGLFGGGLHAARLRDGEGQPAMPAAYVAALFDDYAPRFDAHLVGTLGYAAPALIVEAIAAAVGERFFARALDLGCGTGLMAPPVRTRVGHLAGVDLSAAMVAQAERRGLYDALRVGDVLADLDAAAAASVDLALAADVFAYLGPLEPVTRAAARALRADGLLAFTVQHGEAAVRLGADMRFSHSAGHVATALAAAGLEPVVLNDASSRREAGAAVPGLVVVARKP